MSKEHCWNYINREKIIISRQTSLTVTPCTKQPKRNSLATNMGLYIEKPVSIRLRHGRGGSSDKRV